MPPSISGSVARTRRDGRSRRTSHAISGTKATWRLPSTVARPAPTSSIAWCQQTRSTAKKTPATAARPAVARSGAARSAGPRRGPGGRGPGRRRRSGRPRRSTARPRRAGRGPREKAIVSAPPPARAGARRAREAVDERGVGGAPGPWRRPRRRTVRVRACAGRRVLVGADDDDHLRRFARERPDARATRQRCAPRRREVEGRGHVAAAAR